MKLQDAPCEHDRSHCTHKAVYTISLKADLSILPIQQIGLTDFQVSSRP